MLTSLDEVSTKTSVWQNCLYLKSYFKEKKKIKFWNWKKKKRISRVKGIKPVLDKLSTNTSVCHKPSSSSSTVAPSDNDSRTPDQHNTGEAAATCPALYLSSSFLQAELRAILFGVYTPTLDKTFVDVGISLGSFMTRVWQNFGTIKKKKKTFMRTRLISSEAFGKLMCKAKVSENIDLCHSPLSIHSNVFQHSSPI